jgi:hypothetical protein
VRHGQQGLLSGIQAPPPGPQLGAMGAQDVASMISARLDTVIPEG